MNLYNTSRPPSTPTGCQNSRLAGYPFTLLQSKKARVLALPTGQALLQPQTAEQLSGWEGGDQGRAAKEIAEKDEKQAQSEVKHMQDYIYTKGLRRAGIQRSLNTPPVGGIAQR